MANIYSSYEKFLVKWNYLSSEERKTLAAALSPQVLKLADPMTGNMVVHTIAREGLLPESSMTMDILSLKDEYGKTVAGILAAGNALPGSVVTLPVLMLENSDGDRVVHIIARRNASLIPKDCYTNEVLGAVNSNGLKTIHILAEENDPYLPSIITLEMLAWTDSDGCPTAFWMGMHNAMPEKFICYDVMKIADNNGWTVAHVMAENGFLRAQFYTHDILGLHDKNGITVAHRVVQRGDPIPPEFLTPQIAVLTDRHGRGTALSKFLEGLEEHFPLFREENAKAAEDDLVRLPKDTLPIARSLVEGMHSGSDRDILLGTIDSLVMKHAVSDATESLMTETDPETDVFNEGVEELYRAEIER